MFAYLLVSVLLVCPIFAASWQPKKFEIQPRVVRGQDAKPGQFKYFVSLRRVKKIEFLQISDYNHFCGGTLIGERWIISAAHCLAKDKPVKMSDIRIVVGANHFWRDGELYKVKKIILHEKFNNIYKENDISLLQTKDRIAYVVSYIHPIKIAKEWIRHGQDGIFAGFGVTETGLTPFKLQFIELRVIPNDVCIRRHESANQLLVHNSTLCTFIGYGAGTYHGDSGGGLAIDNKLVGILSWGNANNIKNKPDQFTRLSEFTNWIEQKTGIKAV